MVLMHLGASVSCMRYGRQVMKGLCRLGAFDCTHFCRDQCNVVLECYSSAAQILKGVV